jgi:diguanylate cyclase (GGDEF)-like protein
MNERTPQAAQPCFEFPNGEPLKVLVAEDDPLLRLIMEKRLNKLVSLRIACDGAEAWTMFQQDPPDVLLTDWMMPNMSGLELCQKVKAAARLCYVILMTAKGELDDKVEALECGADEYLVKPVDQRELGARLRAGTRILTTNRQLAAESLTDGLTGLKNRRAFESALAHELAMSNRNRKPFCLIMGDVNRFKAINDSYGHQAGDRVLVAVGSVLQGTLRTTDTVFRLGGDEFAAILPECSMEGAAMCLDRMHAVAAELCFEGMPLPVTLSLGIGVFDPEHPVQADALIKEADERMYQDKRTSRVAG